MAEPILVRSSRVATPVTLLSHMAWVSRGRTTPGSGPQVPMMIWLDFPWNYIMYRVSLPVAPINLNTLLYSPYTSPR